MTITLDGLEQIQFWHYSSRVNGLALEINSKGQLQSLRVPVLAALYLEGFLAEKVRNTQKNRCDIFRQMVCRMEEAFPSWIVDRPLGSPIMVALLDDEQMALTAARVKAARACREASDDDLV